MAYRIIVTARAERDLNALLDNDNGRYPPKQRLSYVRAIRQAIQSLDPWPKRSTPMEVNGREYRRIFHKAHTIFFRVFDDEGIVVIDAVLHSRMDFGSKLGR